MPSPQHAAAMKVAQAHRTNDPKRIRQARRELAETNIEAAVQRNLAKAPPLTPTQIRRLSGLLRTGGQR